MNVLLTGATGTIGRETLRALHEKGYDVFCSGRQNVDTPYGRTFVCDLLESGRLITSLSGTRIDAVVSCMSTRSGAPEDAWNVEYQAQKNLLEDAIQAGARHFVLLSAICVQKPVLAFQHAKLAFEECLRNSEIYWTIIRPTAFFKSLSGQVARVTSGKPFLVFGDGKRTACKPISNRDLASFIVETLSQPDTRGRILPIGGPGPAITPLDQAEKLFEIIGQEPRIRHIPIGLMQGISSGLRLLAPFSKTLNDKAEFAKTGLYYATESMLVWNGSKYDAAATPENGQDTLWDYYEQLVSGQSKLDLGSHSVF